MILTNWKFVKTIASKKGFHLKPELYLILAIFIIMRFVISGTAAAALWNNTPAPPVWIDANHPSMQVFEQTASDPKDGARILLNGWYRWDTGYFVKIGLIGYSAQDGSLSFMPLYPLFIRILYLLTHQNPLLLSLIISNVFCLASLFLFYQVAEAELGSPAGARDALLYFITFPAAFFLFAGYSESLYMTLALLMWLLIRRGSFFWSAFVCSLAILTRLQGAALILPLFWQTLVQLSQTDRLTPRQEVFSVVRFLFRPKNYLTHTPAKLAPLTVVVLAPVITLLFYNWGLKFAGLSTVLGAYSDRSSPLVWPWVAVWEFVNRIFTIQFLPSDYVDLILLIVFISLTGIGMTKIKPALTLYSLCILGMVFMRSYSPNLISGFMRIALTTFPIFLVMAKMNLPGIRKNLVLLLFLATQIFLAWLFINWIWVA